ncbi:hypothetical protein MKK88_21555 [Methylobacterium sp. E-005]|uniref:hypothetical protein n=1 Tax=Methylobacterium sp. E-005 TaxID=2836549 RepID=UPI001FBAF2E9|nr:hypothetical protein [Methylobacterium sp. E-005]MCJ2088544.1 hypothetical protein [Methylobacterium sp. E-005]
MRIRLATPDPDDDPVPEGWLAVGYVLSGEPPRTVLAYDPERRPHAVVAGREPHLMDRAEVNHALVAAVDEAGLALWPGGHTHALPEALGIARRTLARDRIEKAGLPPMVLSVLGSAAQGRQPELTGLMLTALGRFANEGASEPDEAGRMQEAVEFAEGVARLLGKVRRNKLLKKMMAPGAVNPFLGTEE